MAHPLSPGHIASTFGTTSSRALPDQGCFSIESRRSMPVPGERRSGLVVAELRASGRPPVEGASQTVDEPDARGPA
jgi:hypothetical protein